MNSGNVGCQTSYYNRMYKLVEESLDAALYVCNNNMERFTESKIFDVFDQTFPTAFVLGTGYWIFFVSNYGAPLCVCGRFGSVCRHVRSKTHWIDLQPIAERTESIVFTPRIYGAVIPRKYNISIDSSTECNGYIISMDMDLIYTKKVKKEFHVNIRACYGYVLPCYGALFSIRFTPNPVLKANYGKYLDELRIHRAVLMNRQYVEDLIITPYSMPSSGLFLITVNLFKYNLPAKISAVPLTEWDLSKYDFNSKDASTQTTNKNEIDFYKKTLENFTNSIWQYKEHGEAESKFLNFIGQNMDFRFGRTFPVGIDNSEQYDKQFPDMKLKANGSCKAVNNSIIEDSIPKPIASTSVQLNTIQTKFPKVSTAEEADLPNFQDTFLNTQYFAKPQYIRRRRGRPKVPRSYNTVAANKKPAETPIDTTHTISSFSSDNTGSCLQEIHSNSEEQKSIKLSEEQGLAEIDAIVEQVKEKCKFYTEEDYDNELDLINELITEKMESELMDFVDK